MNLSKKITKTSLILAKNPKIFGLAIFVFIGILFVFMPVQAQINTLVDVNVDLVKTVDNPAVYAVIGNQKHLIRNEEVFYSYDYNFRNVKIVSGQELDKYKLVRLARDAETDRVYFLSYGQNFKKYHPNPQAFTAYPNNQWSDVLTINSNDLSFWPEATLLKTVDSPMVYFITDSNKAGIPSENEFINAGFSWGNIMTVAKADLDSYKTIDYSIQLVRDNVIALKADGQLIVSLDASTPKASVIPYSTSGNEITTFKFRAVQNDIKIKSITFSKKGIVYLDRINSIYIEDENGVQFGDTAFINNGQAKIRFAPDSLVIPKNSEKILSVKVNFNEGYDLNYTVSLGIAQESDIETVSQVGGIFPMFGQTHKLFPAQELVGGVKVASLEVNTEVRTVNIGVNKESIAKFRFAEISGSEKAAITKIILTNYGSAKDEDIANIALYKDGQRITLVKNMQNRQAIFNFDENNLVIKGNKSIDLEVKADIVGNENATLKFVIENSGDVVAKGLTQEFNLVVASDEGWPVGFRSDDYNKIEFKREGMGLFAVKLKDTEKKLYRDQEDSVFGVFELRNGGQDIYLQRAKLTIEKFYQATDLIGDIIIQDITNKKDVQEIARVSASKVSGETGDFRLGNSLIKANKTLRIQIIGDVPEDATSGSAYRVYIPEISYKIGLDNRTYIEPINAYGQVMSVFAPSIALSKGELKNKGVAIAGEDNIELSRFNLAVSNDEKIRITSITLSLTNDSDDVSYVGGFSDLALYKGRSRVSKYIEQPNSRTITFNGLKIYISAGKILELTVKADSEVITAGKTIQFRIDRMEAEGYSSGAPVMVENEGVVSDAVSIIAEE